MTEYYLVSGPSSVRVVRGYLEVLGYRVVEGSTVVVPIGRSVPVKVEGEILVSDRNRLTPVASSVYESLDRVAEELSKLGRVMIVGPTDAGKSTLAAWILNKMHSRGLQAYYLTTDIGQNEVYCPGFIALAQTKPPVVPGYSASFHSVRPCFVGSFTPSDAIGKYAECIVKLSNVGEALVIDTDGWVWGDGLIVKARLSKMLSLDALVALGLPGELLELLRSNVDARVLSLPRLAGREKSFEERRAHRERLITLRLLEAKRVNVKVDEVEIEGLPLFKGRPVEQRILRGISQNIVYAEVSEEGVIVAVYRGQKPAELKGLTLPLGWERGLLVAVECGGELNPGVLERIDYRARTLTIVSKCRERIRRIEVGKARVNLEGLAGR